MKKVLSIITVLGLLNFSTVIVMAQDNNETTTDSVMMDSTMMDSTMMDSTMMDSAMMDSAEAQEEVVPVENRKCPETPLVPAFTVRNTKFPLDVDVPSPVLNEIDPPVKL